MEGEFLGQNDKEWILKFSGSIWNEKLEGHLEE